MKTEDGEVRAKWEMPVSLMKFFRHPFELVIVTKHYINIEQGISQDSQLSILLENRIVK